MNESLGIIPYLFLLAMSLAIVFGFADNFRPQIKLFKQLFYLWSGIVFVIVAMLMLGDFMESLR